MIKINEMSRLKIVALSKEKGITQEELAQSLGVHRTSLSNAITKDRLSVGVLKQIADILDVEVYELFENAPRQNKECNNLVCPNCNTPIEITIK